MLKCYPSSILVTGILRLIINGADIVFYESLTATWLFIENEYIVEWAIRFIIDAFVFIRINLYTFPEIVYTCFIVIFMSLDIFFIATYSFDFKE